MCRWCVSYLFLSPPCRVFGRCYFDQLLLDLIIMLQWIWSISWNQAVNYKHTCKWEATPDSQCPVEHEMQETGVIEMWVPVCNLKVYGQIEVILPVKRASNSECVGLWILKIACVVFKLWAIKISEFLNIFRNCDLQLGTASIMSLFSFIIEPWIWNLKAVPITFSCFRLITDMP